MFNVGDRVIVTEGVKQCQFGCNQEMINEIGNEFTIKESGTCPEQYYYLEEIEWIWDDSCFELAFARISDDVSFDDIMGLI